jgi:Flp pilus assembly protein CpaB
VEHVGKRFSGNDWRRLLSTRQGTTIVAIVCTIIAAGIIILAMSRYRQSVKANNAPATVLVATNTIQKGTTGAAISSGRLFQQERIATKQVTQDAIADPALLIGKVAAVNIVAGQQLTQADFTAAGGIAGQLAADQRAIAVPLDSTRDLSGQLQPGDHVDMYVGIQSGSGNATQAVVRLLATNVPVLTITGATGGAGSAPGGSALLQIGADDVAPITFASDNGRLWLALRPGNASAPNPGDLASIQSVLAGKKALGTAR